MTRGLGPRSLLLFREAQGGAREARGGVRGALALDHELRVGRDRGVRYAAGTRARGGVSGVEGNKLSCAQIMVALFITRGFRLLPRTHINSRTTALHCFYPQPRYRSFTPLH